MYVISENLKNKGQECSKWKFDCDITQIEEFYEGNYDGGCTSHDFSKKAVLSSQYHAKYIVEGIECRI